MYSKLSVIVCTCFYVGNIKYAPGTFGSLLAVFTILMLPTLSSGVVFIMYACLVVIALASCKHYLEVYAENSDPSEIVIDEFLAQFILSYSILLEFGYSLLSHMIGFLLFRGFDIVKPWPISYIDSRVNGTVGVMLDDIIAALFAYVSFKFIMMFLPI